MNAPVSEIPLADEELLLSALIYHLTGRFDYGLFFDAKTIPASHIAALAPRFMEYQRECERPVAQIQQTENLRAKLLGIAPETIVIEKLRQREPTSYERPTPRHIAAPPSRDFSRSAPPATGGIDYADMVNDMLKGATA